MNCLQRLRTIYGTTSLRLSSRCIADTKVPENNNVNKNDDTDIAPKDEDEPIFLKHNPFELKKKECILCKMKITPNYKNVRLLSQFQSRYTGRIYGRHITGLCKDKQNRVELEIARAQGAGLMGYYTKEPSYMNDPSLFDPMRPLRPHKY